MEKGGSRVNVKVTGYERPNWPLQAVNTEEATSQGVWAGGPWKLQRHKDGASPGASRMDGTPADTLNLAQRRPFRTSDLQNCKVINVSSFKPLSS